MKKPPFTIIIPDETVARAADYLGALQERRAKPGARLEGTLRDVAFQRLTTMGMIGRLCDTKQPQMFAEMDVAGDGSDWTLTELGLLGDISVAMPVTVFDDGHHDAPVPHAQPFSGTLVFTPGALLRNGRGHVPADWDEVVSPCGLLSAEGYYRLYRRRLLPVLRYVNDQAADPRSALLTVPGLGCGQFAGPFRGQLGMQLQQVLHRLLTEHGAAFPNLKAVYFDPYNTCVNARHEIHGIAFMVRPLQVSGNRAKPQLCFPAAYADPGDDFSDCKLFSIVAWDHVSWPGNDFFLGHRVTDDGVKAAATSAMAAITGVEGSYDPIRNQYRPPPSHDTWGDVVAERRRRDDLGLWNPLAVWRPDPISTPA